MRNIFNHPPRVISLNGLEGILTLVAGTGVTITISGNNITISSSGSPPITEAALFFAQNDNNFYPADLYGTTQQANFNFVI